MAGAFAAIAVAMSGLAAAPAHAADTGSISGTVTTRAVGAAEPTPASSVFIYLAYSETEDGGYQSIDADPSDEGTDGYSFAGSTFSLTGLKAGFYKFEVAGVGDNTYEREYYNDASTLSEATAIQVGTGAVTGKDVMLEPAGQITGRVTDRAGNPLPDVYVAFERSSRGGGDSATTDSQGYFTSARDRDTGFGAGLIPGSYRVQASRYHSSSDRDAPSYEQRYWQGAATYESATPVTVTPGATVEQINIQLDVAPRVRLTVKDPAGNLLPDIDVGVWMFFEGEWGPRRAGPNTTEHDGIYRQTLRIGDRYKYFITPPAGVDGVTEWYDNAYSDATAKEVTATAYGQVLDLTIQLGPAPDAPVITGATPTISGTARSGKTLTATAGSWGPAGVSVSHQWLANGVAVPGATAPRFTLTNAQAGKKVTVTTTGSFAGAAAVATTSAATATVQGVLKATKVSIKGTAKIGKKLRASTSAWGPSPVKSSYTWYRNGKKVSGQQRSTYTLRKADVGKRITVRVTQKKSGYIKASKLSSKTKKVKKVKKK